MASNERVVTRVEALRSLRITPRLFRQLAEEYRSELGPFPMGGLTAEQLETIRHIVSLRSEGTPPEAIRARIQSASSADVDPQGALPEDLLQRIAVDLKRAEEERLEDRDRLLTALIRTQQEIAHLRQELAAATPRRERRKEGFFRRLFR